MQPRREDSDIVRRLREAGAIVIGKTNLPELAIYGFTETPTWGVTRNPWDTSRTGRLQRRQRRRRRRRARARSPTPPTAPARSASPSANCGLFGLKPQRNRVSLVARPGALARALRLRLRQPQR